MRLKDRPREDGLLTTSQAAEYASVCEETIRRWVRGRDLVPARRGRRGTGLGHLFRPEDLDAAVAYALY